MNKVEFVAYPPTSFPYRDLIVLERLPLRAGDDVCEIGVGSGGTTARLARLCGHVTGFEISAAAVQSLRYLEGRHLNLDFVVADVTEGSALAPYERRFNRLVSCDTLEHVQDPAGFFRGVARLLAPGGRFLVTFPNEPREVMHGITRFDSASELAALLKDAGLPEHRIGAVTLTPRAQRVARNFGWRPLRLVQWLLGRRRGAAGKGAPEERPQTFERTRFFRQQRLWRLLAPVVNLYWWFVLRRLAAGPAFEVDWDFRSAPFGSCQILIDGTAPAEAQADEIAAKAQWPSAAAR